MHNITIDFNNPGLPQVIDVMQSDAQSRFIGLTLYDGGVPYSAPSGAQYTVQYRGSGANNMGWYDTIQLSSGTRKAVVVSSSNPNVVTLELAEQALRVNGKVEVSLCVVNNTGYKLNTFPIICRVTGAPYVDPVSVRSYFYVTGLTSEQWLAYVTACQDAQKRAEDAAATFETDPTLSVSGKAADAKAVGRIKEELEYVGSAKSPDLISGSYLITKTNEVGGKIAVGISKDAKYSKSIYMTAGSKLYVRGCAKDNVIISLVASSLSDDVTTATCKVIVSGSSYKTIVYTAPRNEYVWTSSRNELIVFQYSDTIENLKNEISKDKVPVFYKKHLENKIKKIQDTAKSIVTGDSFVFITDVHVGANNMISPLLIDEILSRTSIRKVFFGGDVPTAYGGEESLNEQSEKFRYSFSSIEMFFGAKGNHDFTIENSSSDSSGVTESISWNRDITLRKIETKITAYNSDPMNYYMDSALSKIRYIVLNVYELSQSEEKKNESYKFYPGMYDGTYKWLEEALKVDVDWDVIIFAHSACDESISGYSKNLSPLNQLLDAYSRKEKRTISGDYNNFSVDFSSASGKIIAYICGHNHKDETHVQDNGLLAISTTCDAHYNDDGIQRTVGTTDECAFDVFFVDKKNKKMKSIRIGAGSDREFSYRSTKEGSS